jgi:hypothetical protein
VRYPNVCICEHSATFGPPQRNSHSIIFPTAVFREGEGRVDLIAAEWSEPELENEKTGPFRCKVDAVAGTVQA